MRVVKVYIFIGTHENNPLRVPPMLRGFVFAFGIQGRPPDQVEADPETAKSCKMSDEIKRCPSGSSVFSPFNISSYAESLPEFPQWGFRYPPRTLESHGSDSA